MATALWRHRRLQTGQGQRHHQQRLLLQPRRRLQPAMQAQPRARRDQPQRVGHPVAAAQQWREIRARQHRHLQPAATAVVTVQLWIPELRQQRPMLLLHRELWREAADGAVGDRTSTVMQAASRGSGRQTEMAKAVTR